MTRVVTAILGVCLCTMFFACGGGGQPTADKQWYAGGTLHDKSALDWQKASDANKLATCCDFIAKAWEDKILAPHIQQSIHTVEDMKPYASVLVLEIDSALKGMEGDKGKKALTNQKVSELAAFTMALTGYFKQK